MDAARQAECTSGNITNAEACRMQKAVGNASWPAANGHMINKHMQHAQA